MQVKKFEARTMAEALHKVKSEFGSDAVILSTKNRRTWAGTFGLFGAPVVELAVALDRNPAINKNKLDTVQKKPSNYSSAAAGREEQHNEEEDVFNPQMEEIGALREELKGVKGLIAELKTEKVEQKVSSTKSSPFPAVFHPVYNEMKSAGVSPVLAKNLIEKCLRYLEKKGGKVKTVSEAKEILALAIIDVVKVSGPILTDCEASESPRKIAFVGPTGVGKTTTMAKLAGEYSLKGKKVAFITLDTYRIAAVEQLKIYAKILKVPVEVATTPRELKEKIALFNDKDLILIDTGGRSQKDFSQLSFLKQFFQRGDKAIDLHLLMSATTKGPDLVDIIEGFNELPIKRFLFTKLDESSSYGSILNVAVKYKVPCSYFTTGQKVPEDIEMATSERLADMVLRISQGM